MKGGRGGANDGTAVMRRAEPAPIFGWHVAAPSLDAGGCPEVVVPRRFDTSHVPTSPQDTWNQLRVEWTDHVETSRLGQCGSGLLVDIVETSNSHMEPLVVKSVLVSRVSVSSSNMATCVNPRLPNPWDSWLTLVQKID